MQLGDQDGVLTSAKKSAKFGGSTAVPMEVKIDSNVLSKRKKIEVNVGSFDREKQSATSRRA